MQHLMVGMDKQTSSRITILGFVMTSVIVMYHCGATGVVPLNILDEKMSGGCGHFLGLSESVKLC